MLPIAPLMIEHRLIERMICLMALQRDGFRAAGVADVEFIDEAVRFIRLYADQTHHGKEEDILFRDLAKKDLSEEHRRTMNELIEEHRFGRKTVAELVRSRTLYGEGDASALAGIVEELGKLVEFYPGHIEKEDRHFFIPVMDYFTPEEQASMLVECNEFDRRMIHEQFRAVVEDWQRRLAADP